MPLTAALLVVIFGLDPGYYLHLARGQWRLIWNQVRIEDVLRDASTAEDIKDRLRVTQSIRAYARDSLGLADSENYTTFCDVGGRSVVWALTACPRDRLDPVRWQYPIVGSAPYRGFFDRDRALTEEASLADRGYDTYLRPVGAYSTLGWFRDPILSSMLKYNAAALSDLLIHEMTHATLWIEGKADFNESLAGFVGKEGSLAWMRHTFGEQSDSVNTAVRERADGDRYRRFLFGIASELDSIYSAGLSLEEKMAAREAVYASIQKRYRAVEWETDGYREHTFRTMNNAVISLYRTYNTQPAVFERVHAACEEDMRSTLRVLEGVASSRDPFGDLEKWLENGESER